MSLTFHVLNVGHGSSVVIDYEGETGRHFGVIDCNTGGPNPDLTLHKLQALGATELSFIGLTHPHKDHYSGLFSVIRAYQPNISNFFSFPMGDLVQNKDRLKKLGIQLIKLSETTDGEVERRAAVEFVQILRWANGLGSNWYECAGDENRIAPVGFSSVNISTLLPPRTAKGDYISRIEKGMQYVFGHIDDNDLSLAFQFEYAGKKIILGGDGSKKNWDRREKFEKNAGYTPRADVVNLPHHGSRYDNEPSLIERLFLKEGARYAITSANGISHPAQEVIDDLSSRDIEPYCTNLMPVCGANVTQLRSITGLDGELSRWLKETATDPTLMQPCQGSVTVKIDAAGTLEVKPEFDHFCPFRPTARSLFGIT